MSVNIDSYLSSYLSPYAYTGGTNTSSSSASSVFDLDFSNVKTKKEAQALIDSLNTGKKSSTTTALKQETAHYLDRYSLSMKTLGQSVDNLRGENLDKLLYDKEGKVTDETVKKTVTAFKDMVENYNGSIKLLNDNADRGSGTMKQLARMVDDPMHKDKMAMLGLSVGSDGTLKIDEEKLSAVLKTENADSLKFYKDLIGGVGGLADNIHRDVVAGSNTSARDLVNYDLASISSQSSNSTFGEMYDVIRGSAFLLNNQAAVGMMMNMMA